MRESFLFRIASDPVARIWSGVGDLEIPPDAVEGETALYLGAGQLLNAPDFQQLINGIAERLEFQISGVDEESLRLATEDAPSVKGALCHLGTLQFDEEWQPLWPVMWEAIFRADVLRAQSQPTDGGRSRTVSLSVGTEDTGRSRAPIAFFTDADQRRRSPTDAFFDHIAGINQGTSRRFGLKD